MLQILRAGRRAAERSESGPRLPQAMVMACLVEFGPQPQSEVAARLRLDPSDVVGVVDTLEAEGHALRERDPSDRRRYALAATPEGERWYRDLLIEIEGRQDAFLGGLSDDEREQLQSLLLRVLAHVDERVPVRYRER